MCLGTSALTSVPGRVHPLGLDRIEHMNIVEFFFAFLVTWGSKVSSALNLGHVALIFHYIIRYKNVPIVTQE